MTADAMQTIRLALFMATAGAMIAVAAGMLRAPRPLVRWTGVAFNLAVAAYALKLWNDEVHLLPPFLAFPRTVLAVGTVGWYWLFVMALFTDSRRIRNSQFAAVGALIIVGVAATYASEPYQAGLFLLMSFMQIAMALHAFVIIAQGWKGDLVETRRRLRGPFLATVTAFILVERGFEVWDNFAAAPAWYPMSSAIALSVICLAGSFVFLESRNELFGTVKTPADVRNPSPERPSAPGRTPFRNGTLNGHGAAYTASGNGDAASLDPANLHPAGLDRAAKADLERLQALMSSQQVWREEGLTIASLALRAGMPEAQLRRLISDCLGYRNFPSFVNAHRIAAAKARLSDPNEARISISAIAFDMGFASLGPFNRAFREVTGVSPSEWRRGQLNEPSPIPDEA